MSGFEKARRTLLLLFFCTAKKKERKEKKLIVIFTSKFSMATNVRIVCKCRMVMHQFPEPQHQLHGNEDFFPSPA